METSSASVPDKAYVRFNASFLTYKRVREIMEESWRWWCGGNPKHSTKIYLPYFLSSISLLSFSCCADWPQNSCRFPSSVLSQIYQANSPSRVADILSLDCGIEDYTGQSYRAQRRLHRIKLQSTKSRQCSAQGSLDVLHCWAKSFCFLHLKE